MMFKKANQSIELIDKFLNCVDQSMLLFKEGVKNYLYNNTENFNNDIKQLANNELESEFKGIYLIRDDTSYLNYFNIDFSNFKNSFVVQLSDCIPRSIKCKYIDVKEQLSQDFDLIEKTVSLDKYYKGDYNLNISRIFEICDFQKKCVDFNCEGIIPEYTVSTIIDDDIISGSTIEYVEKKYNLKIVNKIALNSKYCEGQQRLF